jgi:small-conductance mechanosensitive channel
MLELLGVLFFLREAPFPDPIVSLSRHAVSLIFIGALAWLGISMLYAVDAFVERRFPTSVADNLAARQLKTRIEFFRRMGAGVVILIASATILLTFPSVQYLGTSLLASAGLTGIIAGIAAQRTIGNLIAGLQIAVSQPLRLDDVVVIEGEWGRIEEIGATHVTVALWDKRTLVVPLSYFMDHSFQNWTRKSAQLLGTVLVYTDYAVPVDDVRAELLRILEASELWDGVTWGLQVTGASLSGLELRALMSAHDGPTAWDLRCHVREKLVDFLSRQHPQSLPRTRVLVAPREPEKSIDFLGGG